MYIFAVNMPGIESIAEMKVEWENFHIRIVLVLEN